MKSKFKRAKKKSLIIGGTIVLAAVLAIGAIQLRLHQINTNISVPSGGASKIDNTQQPTNDATQPKVTTATVPVAPKVVDKPEEAKPATTDNPFEVGFSGWYVYEKRHERGLYMSDGNKDSNTYCASLAQKVSFSGVPTSSAIACTNRHVAIVEQVNGDGSFWVSEMNSAGQKSISDTTPVSGWYKIDFRLISAEQVSAFKFIQ